MSSNAASQSLLQAYRFTFNNSSSLQSQFSSIVRAKLDSLGLAEEDASDLSYITVSSQPFVIDVFVPTEAEDDQVDTMLIPKNIILFSTDSQSDDPEVKIVTNRGAIRTAPLPPDPLP